MSEPLSHSPVLSRFQRKSSEGFFGWSTLALWCVFVLLINALWLKIDQRNPRWDESTLLFLSEYSFDKLRSGEVLEALRTHDVSSTKPGLVSFLSAISYFVFGNSTKIAIFLNSACSLVLIFIALFVLGRRLATEFVGIAGILLFTAFPGVFLWSRYYNLDLPLTAAVIATTAAGSELLSSSFRSKRASVALAVAIAAGLAVKHLYAGIAFVPLVVLVGIALWPLPRTGSMREQRRIKNFFISLAQRWFFFVTLAVGTAAGLAYHALNYKVILEQLDRQFNHETSAISWWKPISTSDYLWSVVTSELGSALDEYYLVLGALGVLTLLVIAVVQREKRLLVLWFSLWIGWFLYFLTAKVYAQATYYFLPILPHLALLMSLPLVLLTRLPHQGRRLAQLAGVGLLSIMPLKHYLEESLGTPNPLRVLQGSSAVLAATTPLYKNPFASYDYWSNAYVDGNSATLPYPPSWDLDPLLRRIDDLKINPGTIVLNSMTDYEWITGDYLYYRIWALGLQHKLQFARQLQLAAGETSSTFLQKFDVMLLKKGEILKHDFYSSDWAKEMQGLADTLLANNGEVMKQAGYSPDLILPLPDGSSMQLWLRKKAFSDIDLLGLLPQARITADDANLVTSTAFTIEGTTLPVLFTHPPGNPSSATSVTFPEIKLNGSSCTLTAAIALSPATWSESQGDGVLFKAKLSKESGNSGVMKEEELFTRFLDPKHQPKDRHWIRIQVPIPASERGTAQLTLSTSAGIDNRYDHAGWGTPVVSCTGGGE